MDFVSSSGRRSSLAVVAGDDGEIVPLAPALEWIILPQWMSGELLRHDKAAQVRMALKADPKEIPDLSLQPIGGLPDRRNAADRRPFLVV